MIVLSSGKTENPMIEIRRIEKGESLPLGLLSLADPSEEAVADYTGRGDCYGAYRDGSPVGVCVLLRTRPFTMELVNLAVDEAWQGRGIGKRLIGHAVRAAREAGCRVLEVGTGNAGIGQLALYQKCGFEIDSVDKDFFRRHYAEKIVENGIECRHMIRLKMEL